MNRAAGERCPSCPNDVADIIETYTDARSVRAYKVRCPACGSVWLMTIA